MIEDRFLKRLRKKARKGLRGWPIASCILWSEPQPSDEGDRWHRAIRECRGERVARLESGPRGRSCRLRSRPGDIGIYGEAWSAIGRDDRRNNRLPAPAGNRLRRRMVSDLRVLARTRSLYWAEGPLILREMAGHLPRLKDVIRWLRVGLISESQVWVKSIDAAR